ncbi:MAG: cupin domain-containing protein, partial [Gemmatimonadetes bacterium]|nr:cupin domain-containing protein [Gemmatimonadota bacterium]
THVITPYDCVYVAPGTTHQFRATGTEPLGFLCMVDRVRDRPQVLAR